VLKAVFFFFWLNGFAQCELSHSVFRRLYNCILHLHWANIVDLFSTLKLSSTLKYGKHMVKFYQHPFIA